VDKWFTSTGKGDLTSFGYLMTEDFQLLAFGKRRNKAETLAMANGMSDIKYKLSNIRSGFGGDIAYLTFNVDLDFNFQGRPNTGRALETYLFRRENNEWKVHTKMLVMVEEENN
jgi:ketosteroid isomerase-like protein